MRLRGGMDVKGGEWSINGFKAADLAQEYGTPLYIYNELFIREQCRKIVSALKEYPAKARAFYASKAFPCAAIDKIVHSCGMGVDACAEGEMRLALRAGVPGCDIAVHGVNKGDAFLRLAVEAGAGTVVLDSIGEIARLEAIALALGRRVKVLLRLNPGVEAETHKAVRTANLDTKFGIPLLGNLAMDAVARALASPSLDLVGVHCHVGSQVFKMDVFPVAAGILLSFMKEARELGARDLNILNLGGGFGSWYRRGDTPMALDESVRAITQAVLSHCARLDMPLPELEIEPGRAVVAESAVAVYTVGAIKEIPGVNTYLVTDGGLYENPRPLFYGSHYSAYLPRRMGEKSERTYSISGMSCENDIVIHKARLPRVSQGELLLIPSAGAYQLAMAGNYNRMPRPAALLVNERRAALIQRRETFDEVLSREIMPQDL